MNFYFELDRVNRECYNAIANEYDSNNHSTCRDFEKFNKFFLENCLEEFCDNLNITKYLDIGVGTGKSLEIVLKYLYDKNKIFITDVVDISQEMLKVTKKKFESYVINYYNESIFTFNSNKKYDLIVSTLCDPFLTSEYIKILANLVSDEGIIIFTFPSATFAKKIRKNYKNNKFTLFHNKNRKVFESYSFCWDYNEMLNIIKNEGFEAVFIRNYLIKEYKHLLNSNKLLNSINNDEDFVILSGFVIKQASLMKESL